MEKRVWFRSRWLPWLLLTPQLLVVSVFFFWPAGQALIQSLQQQDAFGTSISWVGLDNFRALLADATYLGSVQTTLVFGTLVSGLALGLGLLLAVFAERVVFGAGVYKSILIIPYAVAPVVTGVLWTFMFSTSIGVVSHWLGAVGVHWNHLLDGHDAMALVVMAAVWKQIPYNFLFFLAGLQSIPKSLLEAAAMDGAGVWRRFWTIQLPLLSPTAFFLLVVNLVYAFFETFAVIDATTQGGPGRDTSTLVYRAYFDGFQGMDFGSAAAQSVVLMAMVVALTVVQFRFLERKVVY
jgi:sn-glycerol 3-phosphate transport system permease protein